MDLVSKKWQPLQTYNKTIACRRVENMPNRNSRAFSSGEMPRVQCVGPCRGTPGKVRDQGLHLGLQQPPKEGQSLVAYLDPRDKIFLVWLWEGIHFQTHASWWPASAPCSHRSQVPMSLLAVGWALFSIESVCGPLPPSSQCDGSGSSHH